MAFTKKTVFDKIETTNHGDFFSILVREKNTIFEDGVEISSGFKRSILHPDYDASTITDATVKAQFQAVMTDEVKTNYEASKEAQNAAFKEAQEAELNSE